MVKVKAKTLKTLDPAGLGLSLSLLTDRLTKAFTMSKGWGQWNRGGVLGTGETWWWEGLMVMTLIWLWFYMSKGKASDRKAWGWGLVLGAGISNLIDRLVWGGVWDFIYYPFVDVVGNVADVLLITAKERGGMNAAKSSV